MFQYRNSKFARVDNYLVYVSRLFTKSSKTTERRKVSIDYETETDYDEQYYKNNKSNSIKNNK